MTLTNTGAARVLTSTRAEIVAAQTAHQANTEALARGRERLEAARTEIARLDTANSEAVARHARRLEQHARDGKSGELPQLMPPDKHIAAEIAARRTFQAATLAVASLEAAEQQSRQALARAEAAHRDVALAILADEGDALAQRLIDHDAEGEAMRQQLAGLRDLVPPSALVRRAVFLPSDWVNVPLNELRELEAAGGRHTRLRADTPLNKLDRDEIAPEAIEHWRARLESLLSGAAEAGEPARERAA
jgi:hypothetical protein